MVKLSNIHIYDNIKKNKKESSRFQNSKFNMNDGEIIQKKKRERKKIRYFQKLNLQNKPIKKIFPPRMKILRRGQTHI